MKQYIIFVFSLSYFCANAQFSGLINQSAISLGYNYVGKKSFSLGLEYNHIINEYHWEGVNLGIGTRYFKGEDRQSYLVPELRCVYRYYGTLVGMQLSTKHFNPIVGLNFLGFMQLYSGYSIPFDKDKTNLNGIILGVNLFIAKKNSRFYDSLKIGF